jgi:hypothetical protein
MTFLRKYVVGIALIIFVLFGVFITLYRNHYLNRENTVYTKAVIKDSYLDIKARLFFKIEFETESKTYFLNERCSNLGLSDSKNFIGKWFPIAYSKNKPDVFRLLVTPTDFMAFNLEYPDSLNWTKNYIE